MYFGFFEFKMFKAMNHMSHVTKFLLIFNNDLSAPKKKYRFKILGN